MHIYKYYAICTIIIFFLMFFFILNTLQPSNEFGETFLINLERRTDRLQRFLKGYNSSDLKGNNITKFHAVDGSRVNMRTVPITDIAALELKQLETTGFRYKHYQLTKGAIGCYLSHVRVWKRIMQSNQERALIFEDDASIPPNCGLQMKKAMQHIPDDWDIIVFGKHCSDCEDKGKYVKVNRFILLHAYMINRTAITKIAKEGNLFPISQQLDAYLSEISYTLNIYAPKTNIVNQSQSRTDIQAPLVRNSKMNDRMILSKK